MEYQSQSNGAQTFLEHWGLPLLAVIVFLTPQLHAFFATLNGGLWIGFASASFTLMIAGAGLIGRAKLPLYRNGRFFTSGIRAVPEHLAGHYRWGWRLFLSGVVLSLCLLLPGF